MSSEGHDLLVFEDQARTRDGGDMSMIWRKLLLAFARIPETRRRSVVDG